MNCGRMSDPCEITEDRFLGGRLCLRQPKSGHRAGHDATLLAAATLVRPGDRVVEFGAGVGAAGLALASQVSNQAGAIDLVLVEINESLAALARDNASANNLSARIITLDVTAPADAFRANGLLPESADVVLMNPPFNDAMRHRASPDSSRGSR
jgi:tRNA1(Val) A37 N6-methylase TrmN6